MNPSLHFVGGKGLYALVHFLTGHPDTVSARDRVGSLVVPSGNIAPASDSGLDLHQIGSLNETRSNCGDSDAALCKLALINDDDKHPRNHKGSFGHDFHPFM